MRIPEQDGVAPGPGSGPALPPCSQALEIELAALEAMLPPEPRVAAEPGPEAGPGAEASAVS